MLKLNFMDNPRKCGNKTNKKMMILSFFGILFVVLGHTNNQLPLISNIFPIYSFHMALFIFISGYFYNVDHEKNIFRKDGYLLKKTKKLLLPYFIWNIIYGIVVTLLNKIGIVSYGSKISLNTLFVRPWITGHQFILNIAAWFLLALFIVNIVYILIRTTFTKIHIWNDNIFLVTAFILTILSVYLSSKNLGDIYIPIFRTMFFMFFYHFGYYYKVKLEGKYKINAFIYCSILVLINLLLLKLGTKLDYRVVFMSFTGDLYFVPVVASITGILFWLEISKIFAPAIGDSKVVNYIGNNTYTIMMHHMFWIFVMNLIIYWFSGILGLSGFDVIKFRENIFYFYTAGVSQIAIVYTFVIIAMPLSMKYLCDMYLTKHIK